VLNDLMRMTTRLFSRALAAACTVLLCGGVHAQSAIYKCVDPQGRVEFTDTVKPGCKSLDLPSSYAAPARRAGAAPRQGSASVPVASPATSPANFPRVDTSVQKARDDDRRGILNEELRAEEKKLADLKTTFNGGEPERQGNEKNYAKYQERVASMKEDIARAERNIVALRREISNIR
jgi:hypothetical protein